MKKQEFKKPKLLTLSKLNKQNKNNLELLNADDTIFDDIKINTSNSWLSKTKKPDIKKRKSEEDPTSIPGPSHKISKSESNDTTNYGNSLEFNDSIFFDVSETQCFREFDLKEQKSDEIKEIQTPFISDTELNEIFNNNSDEIQCSQRFLNDIRELETNFNFTQSQKSILNFENDHIIKKNIKNGSEYIQKQREMSEINSQNLNEELEDKELSELLNSSQYHKEIEDEFINCEKTIIAAKSDDESDERSDINLLELNEINWDSPIHPSKTRNNESRINKSMIIRNKLSEIRDKTYGPQSPSSIQLKPVSSSKFSYNGPFFGLPLKVKSLIKEYKGIDELYNWQKECLSLPAILNRNNLIYALPTSGGKTLVAEILMLREILCRRKNVIFILPYVSIVQEKVWSLSPFAVALNFLVETYAAGKGKCPPVKRRNKKSIYICTIEKSLLLIDSLIETNRLNEFGLIIVDELHLLGESNRGGILEMTLTKSIFIKSDIQIVGMSATIGNLNEISKFLNADIYTRDFRPVELQEYIKCGSDILRINNQAQSIEESFIFHRTLELDDYTPDKIEQDRDHITALVMEVIPKESCLIFCSSKKNCESVALNLSKLLNSQYIEYRKDEKINLMELIKQDTASPLCEILTKTIPYGIAYHHSGLTIDERKHLEDAFRLGIIYVICCTSTLAAGVNLPAKRVIIRSPYVGNNFLTLSRYKQMVGRAGRAGMIENNIGESFLICQSKDNGKIAELLCSPMDQVQSVLYENNFKTILSLVLSVIDLKIADKRPDIKRLLSSTLLAVQAQRLNININEVADQIIQTLFRKKALQKKNYMNMLKAHTIDVDILDTQQQQNVETSQKILDNGKRVQIFITNSIPFEISKLGRASVRGCFDLDKANNIYKDICAIQKGLVLSDNLHLLFLLVPIDKVSDIKLNMTLYYNLYNKLNSSQLLTAHTVGITESCAIKMATGKVFKPEMDLILRRFFMALLLQDLWNHKTVYEVSRKFDVDRGTIQQLMSLVASNASALIRFCEELEEFWGIKELITCISKRLTHFCTQELLPLMDLPSVKIGRAKQLYNAGYKTLQSIATASSRDLVNSIDHMNYRVAKQLIAAAKLLLLEKVETLREEVQDVLDHLKPISH